MIRKIIQIDEEKCNGCGDCIPNCAEGALQLIDGKARLISDLFCDGLGASIGHCPLGAIEIIEREAESYNEVKVMDTIVKGGLNVIKAHLKHLLDHGEKEYHNIAIKYLDSRGIKVDWLENRNTHQGEESNTCHCDGTKETSWELSAKSAEENISQPSQLYQWPIQMHLVQPGAAYFKNSDLLLQWTVCRLH